MMQGVRTPTLPTVGLLVMLSACRDVPPSQSAPVYDLVIVNARVMDPASGLDAIRTVGVTGGTIRAVSDGPLQGRDTLDARGLVVAPGFIDLHQHAQDAAGYRVAALDGTTTALELEGGTADVDRWYVWRAGTSFINNGVSVGHDQVRMPRDWSRTAGPPTACGSSDGSGPGSESRPYRPANLRGVGRCRPAGTAGPTFPSGSAFGVLR
jgi:Amidohydrolase family